MKQSILFLFLISGYAYAQRPVTISRRDSIPADVPMDRMPNSRPGNSFYRDSRDPQNVVRATLDNMPVSVPDTLAYYTMKVHGQQGPKRRPPRYWKSVPLTPPRH
ncbi:hypothetical protein WBJ53_17055 [Spirosoma sp. SC4-14]|uniref:hypothetical protein n=1 Tax=Spirosoma sp. SC4-14 TaxID=3128900 RepID=UPI0030CAAF56